MVEKFYDQSLQDCFDLIFSIDTKRVPYGKIENPGNPALLKYRLKHLNKKLVIYK